MVTKPHVLSYQLPATSGGQDPVTGSPLPDVPGDTITVPCRYHADSSKVFKNEDSTESQQIGRVRLDAGVAVPVEGTIVTVTNSSGAVQFTGPVRERFVAQLSGRLEV